MSDSVIYICVLIAVIFFAGEPSLHDAAIERLTEQDACTNLATDKGDSDE